MSNVATFEKSTGNCFDDVTQLTDILNVGFVKED